MKRSIVLFALALAACQPAESGMMIIDGGSIQTIQTDETIPAVILTHEGIALAPEDRVFANGALIPLTQALDNTTGIQLQIRRAVQVTVNGQAFKSAGLDVGSVLSDAGVQLYKNDLVKPPLTTPIYAGMEIQYIPSREFAIYADNSSIQIRSAESTVGGILSQAGIPLIGLDYSSPPENEAPPPDGKIRVVRVGEKVESVIEQIPFTTQRIESKDVPLGQSETIEPGMNGLALTRTRIRYEDGVEISRVTEEKSTILEPVTRVVATGGQVSLAPVPGGAIPYDYWLAYEMYATVYSPCNSGINGCSYGTASGARAGQGIVAVDYSIYNELAGMRVYIPGYGVATIGDLGGGPIIESALGVARTKWIDLGFNEGEMRDMTGWVTVYFLAPAPEIIPYFLK